MTRNTYLKIVFSAPNAPPEAHQFVQTHVMSCKFNAVAK